MLLADMMASDFAGLVQMFEENGFTVGLQRYGNESARERLLARKGSGCC